MQIDGLTFDIEIQDVIETLRDQLAEQGINRFEKIIDTGTDIMVQCPYHKNGQERKPSAGIRKSDGLFHCLACGETHSLPEMISDCLGYNNSIKGRKWLVDNFKLFKGDNRERIVLNFGRGNNRTSVSSSVFETISEEELDSYRYTHNYLYERGLTDDIIEHFDLGYDKATDSITFPVRDKNGDCMFVARRSVKTKYFDLPKGINKPLYGMYELSKAQRIDKLYVCEGLFDCLRLWCVGKFAVAGFGCLFNNYQIKQLQDFPCRTVVLALDNDEAGRKATDRLRKLLTNKIIKEAVLPKSRKDIGECTDEELLNLQENLI